ncbi:hypothetical protein KSP40_PGU010366 [Platanthera guangdongensis]|uniref:Uncharacterized protein n=1 Tax=Platanthera guangdongensis TaxID=2320717 RepID=A0ABR2LQR2_9ASPA
MEITGTFHTPFGIYLGSPTFVEHHLRFSCSQLSPRNRFSSTPAPPPLRLNPKRPPPSAVESPVDDGRLHRTFLVEAFHQKRDLKALFDEISRTGSCPLHILARDGDWPFEKLLVVVAFLADSGRATEALQHNESDENSNGFGLLWTFRYLDSEGGRIVACVENRWRAPGGFPKEEHSNVKRSRCRFQRRVVDGIPRQSLGKALNCDAAETLIDDLRQIRNQQQEDLGMGDQLHKEKGEENKGARTSSAEAMARRAQRRSAEKVRGWGETCSISCVRSSREDFSLERSGGLQGVERGSGGEQKRYRAFQ